MSRRVALELDFGSWILWLLQIASYIYWYTLFQVFLCFGNSVASTRFLLQDEFNIQTTQCDNCIIVFPLSLSLYFSLAFTARYMQMFFQWYSVNFMYIFYLGFHVLPSTNCMYILHCCHDCWKRGNSRGFSVAVLFGWLCVLHVRLPVLSQVSINCAYYIGRSFY